MASGDKLSIEQIVNSLKALPWSRRIVLGVVAVGVPLAFTLFILQGKEPNYGLLFSQLRQEDAALVTEKLREQKVPFRLEKGGANIMVPVEQVYELRLQLAAEGLPRGGGAGFELLDKMPMGSTGFVQRLNYVRALQGELARTIQDLEAVEAARVHVVMPRKSLFLEEEKATTASVLLRLHPGTRLTKRQINGISYLVARAVEGLDPANVTLVDVNGNVLGGGRGDTLDQITASQLEYQVAFERNLERRVQTMLGKVTGPQNVIVRVSAELDFRRVEETNEAFDPEGAVIRSEQQGKESSSTPRSGGATGDRNAAGSATKATREDTTTNFEISKTVRHVQEAVGKPKRISVAVLIGTPKPGEGEGKTSPSPRLDEDQINQIRTLVRTAIGFDQERGDRVEVVKMPYDLATAVEEQSLEAAGSGTLGPTLVQTLIRYGSMSLVGVLVLLFFVRPLMRWAMNSGEIVTDMIQLPKTVGELENELDGEVSHPAALESAHGDPAAKKKGHKEKLHEVAREEPDRLLSVAKNWLQEQA